MPDRSRNRRTLRVPSLRHCNGRGFVELSGHRFYLGPWGAPETDEAYRRQIAEWIESGRRLLSPPETITVVELSEHYLQHAQEYYRRPDGSATASMDHVREAIRMLCRMYGRVPVVEFGPMPLRVLRNEWVNRGLSRATVNTYVRNVRMIFKWGVSRELVTANVLHALQAVEGLRQGRSAARDSEQILPAPEHAVDLVKERVSRQVAALIDLQLLCGARSGEIVGLRPCDIDQSGEVWTVHLSDHKTAHAGRMRVLKLGPRAQSVIRPFLLRAPDAPMFSPIEAEAERYARAGTHRRANQKANSPMTERRLGRAYTADSYRRAIERACEEAGVDKWTPHQLRHLAATKIRQRFGLDAAQVVLGHANANVTQVYAEVDFAKAAQIMREVG